MNWEAFTQEVKTLSDKIDFQSDMIVAISRGGLIPGRLLSTFLNIKNLNCLKVTKVNEERKVLTEFGEDFSNKKVLLVEDMLETGRSLVVAKEYLEKKGAKVKTACLYTMPISEIKPDYFIKQISEVEKFPWEDLQ